MSRITTIAFGLLICMRCIATTPEQLALAHDVMKVMNADKMLETMVPQLQQMAAHVARQSATQNGFSSEEASQMAKAQKMVVEIMMESVREILPEMERAYADTYTEAELRAMKTFYSSPEGQAMLTKQPELMKKIAPVIQDAALAAQPKVQRLIQQAADRIIAERRKKSG